MGEKTLAVWTRKLLLQVSGQVSSHDPILVPRFRRRLVLTIRALSRPKESTKRGLVGGVMLRKPGRN
jgi:hypothetical protein